MGRKDAHLVKNLPRYRQLMPYLMPTRNESVVYYDTYVRAEKLYEYLEECKKNPNNKITLTHALIKACVIGFAENPKMNQYISGHRLYQREKIEVSFSMKKEKVSHSPLKVVKMEFKPEEPLLEMAERINSRINVERSEKKTYTDKEVDFLTRIPRFILRFLVSFVRWLDYHNLLPYSFIKNDPLYASIFIANLGSFGMDAGFHHLYEYGQVSLFGMVGKVQDMAVVEEGKIVARKILHIRWTYDERIDDGMTAGKGIESAVKVLENPEKYFEKPSTTSA